MSPRRPNEPSPGREGRDEDERKERVIHTRVPERLENELKERAADLGVSVSNLVRNVLTHAFGLVGDIVADGAQVARTATSGWRSSRGPEPAHDVEPEVVGWQPLVLNKNAVCSLCNDILPRGCDAALAIVDPPDAGLARPIVCPRCLEEIRHGDHASTPPGSDPAPSS